MEQERQALARDVERRRRAKGWSKERAAREAEISSITWKRIEDGLPVQDVKLAAAMRVLGIDAAPVGPEADAPTFTTGPGDVPSGPTLTDDEVLALIRENRRLADELERRIRGST